MASRTLSFPLAVAAALAVTAAASACPFCTSQGQTLSNDAAQAGMILLGKLTNPQLDPNDVARGTTDLVIEDVVKKHDILAGRKVLTLPRYIPVDKNGSTRFLVFCDVFNGKVDPYRGVQVKPDSTIAPYLKGAFAVKDKPVGERLRYFFDYLDASDIEVSNDAYMEFGNADYKDFRPMAEKAPAAKVAAWLTDPNTPASRFGLYGSLLGHCGKPADAKVLRDMLDDPKKRFSTGLDGMLAGYVMLDKKAGWDYLTGTLADGKKDFMTRYAGLRAVRFFWEQRPDVLPREVRLAAVAPLLDQSDIADLAVEDLRRWKEWGVADKVLLLFGKESHDVPIVRRSIMRYALAAEADKPAAAQFVAAQRKRDNDWVKDIEELLKLESQPAVAAPATAQKPAPPGAKPPSP